MTETKNPWLIIAILFMACGGIVGAFLFGSSDANSLKKENKKYKTEMGLLHKQNDSIIKDRSIAVQEAVDLRADVIRLDNRNAELTALLVSNDSQLQSLKSRYEKFKNARYDTLSSAGILRYFTDSLSVP